MVEGVRLLEEALNSGVVPELVLVNETQLAGTERGKALLQRLATIGYVSTTPAVLKKVAETETPQGVVASVPIPEPAGMESQSAVALLVDGVQDPGNLGTILRTAEAAGARPVLLAPNTVDVYSPKVVRAGMGAHFRLPLLVATWPEIATALSGRRVWLAEAQGGTPYYEVDWTEPAALIVGNEARGVGPEAAALATGSVTIPMVGPTESLNAAVAAAVILFESLRQRRAISDKTRVK